MNLQELTTEDLRRLQRDVNQVLRGRNPPPINMTRVWKMVTSMINPIEDGSLRGPDWMMRIRREQYAQICNTVADFQVQLHELLTNEDIQTAASSRELANRFKDAYNQHLEHLLKEEEERIREQLPAHIILTLISMKLCMFNAIMFNLVFYTRLTISRGISLSHSDNFAGYLFKSF